MAVTCTSKCIILSALVAVVVITGIVLAATLTTRKPYNSCLCTNGTGRAGRFDDACAVDPTADYCSSCDEGFYMFEMLSVNGSTKYECRTNQCACPNGHAPTGINCPVHDMQRCNFCDAGHHREVDPSNGISSCEPNECFCFNGTPDSTVTSMTVDVNGDWITYPYTGCTVNGQTSCSSCDANFHLQTINEEGRRIHDRCEANICQCYNGVPFTPCVTHGATGSATERKCESCDSGYSLLSLVSGGNRCE